MAFNVMSDEDWDAIRKHHDALIEMAELELREQQIRETHPNINVESMLKPIEQQLHELDRVIAELPA